MTAWPAVTSKSLHSSISSHEHWGVKKLFPERGALSRRDVAAQSTCVCEICSDCGALSELCLVHSVFREES